MLLDWDRSCFSSGYVEQLYVLNSVHCLIKTGIRKVAELSQGEIVSIPASVF